MIQRTAIINAGSNIVENVIITDDAVPYSRSAGFLYVNSETADIGDTYDNGQFIPPPLVTPYGD